MIDAVHSFAFALLPQRLHGAITEAQVAAATAPTPPPAVDAVTEAKHTPTESVKSLSLQLAAALALAQRI
jgi:hypothetical protein